MARRTTAENAFLFLLPVVGVAVGLTSAITAHIIAFLQNAFWGSGTNLLGAAESNPLPLRVIIPVLGGLLVGVIGWFFRVQTRGGGVTTIMQAVSLKGGVLSLRETVPRDWAAMVTISTGGSLGREGAMAMLASAVASHLGRRLKLTTQQLRVLVCAGAAGALASVYNAPIGGALFALEILLGSFALEALGPVVVVTVISTLVFRSAMGNLPRFEVPRYEFVSSWELLFYLGLGVLTGLAAYLFVRALFGAQDLFERVPLPRWLKPAIGMGLVGVIGLHWPQVFGNGFEAVNLTLREQLPLLLLVGLLFMKLAASALTFGAGGAGGLFTPSLMVGALTGAVFGYGVHTAFPHVTADYGAYALVGMGGVLAGMTHAPLMAIMMVFEQTNSYQVILPLMFVCIVSQVTVRVLKSRSLEEESLLRRGIVLPTGPEASVMKTLRVADVMHDEIEAVNQRDPFRKVVEYFLSSSRNFLYVIDDDGRFVGAISLHAMKDMLTAGQSMDMVIALDLAEPFEFATPTEFLAETMDKFWTQNSERLPVLADAERRQLVGWISKRDLLGIYSQEILKKRQVLSRFTMTAASGAQQNAYVELPAGFQVQTFIIPPQLADRSIAEIAPRSTFGVHVLQITHLDPLTRKQTVEMPGPNSLLRAHDRLVVIGPDENINRLQRTLNVEVEKPKL